jgi:putative SOS response-associated peptidase YedK
VISIDEDIIRNMCGRFIAREIDFHRIAAILASLPKFEEFTEKPKFDPAKTQSPNSMPAKAVKNQPGGGGSGDVGSETSPSDLTPVIRVTNGRVSVDRLKWGLVPPHAPEPKVDYATFNAKAETVATTAAYRHAWRERQRCLVPVNAFFELKGAKTPKQKYRISVKGESQFCLAGLWEKWQRGDEVLETFTVITTTANDLVAEIHDKKRMPVIIAPANYDQWLRSCLSGRVMGLICVAHDPLPLPLPVSPGAAVCVAALVLGRLYSWIRGMDGNRRY